MNDDQSDNGSGKRTWVEKIGQAFTHQPRDRDELLETLRDSRDSGIVDADALAMMEGALDVSETQVRDAMIPRSQMVVVHFCRASWSPVIPGSRSSVKTRTR